MGYPDASLRGWVLELDVGIPTASLFLMVIGGLIQLLVCGFVTVYFLSHKLQPADATATLWEKLKTSRQFWYRLVFLVLVVVLGTVQIATTCQPVKMDVDILAASHPIFSVVGTTGELTADVTFDKTTFNAAKRENTVDYGWRVIAEEALSNAARLPDRDGGEPRHNISGALAGISAFPATITLEHVVGEAIQEGNCGRWQMLFWYSAALIFCTTISSHPREYFLGEGVSLIDYGRYFLSGVTLPSFGDLKPDERSYGGQKLGVGFWTLMPSAFITWIFAKSIHNSALLGGRYGMVGGVAYASWYVSFVSAAIVGYVLRTKYGYQSLPEAINRTYGPIACLLFMLCVLFRLFNEVWSNATVVGQFYGRVGTSGYWGAAWFSVLVPSLYIAMGGMRGSLFTDFLQAWGGVLILIAVIIALSVDSTFDETIFSFSPAHVQPLNKGGEPGWEPGCGLMVGGGLVQGIISYPFFDSVLTDRAFLSTPRTMFLSLTVGGGIAATFIVFFSSLGTYGAFYSDRYTINCDCKLNCPSKGLVTAPGALTEADCEWWASNRQGWGSWGTSAYVGTLLAKNVDESMQVLMNFIMITASLSTLDSTFTSIAKLVALEFGGWLQLDGDRRGVSAPLRPHDVEHISRTHIWVARAAILVLMFVGVCFLGYEKDAMSATTVAGTAIMGIGFPIWSLLIWKTDSGDGKGWRRAPLAFVLPLVVGWYFGIKYYADGRKDANEDRLTHDHFQFTNYDNDYSCETITDYANCVSAAPGASYGTANHGCGWLDGVIPAGGGAQLKGNCTSVDGAGAPTAQSYAFSVRVVLKYSRFFGTNLVGHLCCLGAFMIGWTIHQFVIPNMTDPVMGNTLASAAGADDAAAAVATPAAGGGEQASKAAI